MGPSRSCWKGKISALKPGKITSKGTIISCVLSIKVPIRRVWKLIVCTSYQKYQKVNKLFDWSKFKLHVFAGLFLLRYITALFTRICVSNIKLNWAVPYKNNCKTMKSKFKIIKQNKFKDIFSGLDISH